MLTIRLLLSPAQETVALRRGSSNHPNAIECPISPTCPLQSLGFRSYSCPRSKNQAIWDNFPLRYVVWWQSHKSQIFNEIIIIVISSKLADRNTSWTYQHTHIDVSQWINSNDYVQWVEEIEARQVAEHEIWFMYEYLCATIDKTTEPQ